MPREIKKRGRRADQKKRKLDDEPHVEHGPESKRQRQSRVGQPDEYVPLEGNGDQHPHQPHDDEPAEHGAKPETREFYGLLEDDEQEYFRRADEMLELNEFGDAEERSLFLANVYREAEGKELKLANSQSCSRLVERLVQLSTADQLKQLFQKFAGHFPHLVTHRFASHCCEALFIQAAPVVTSEMLSPVEQRDTTDPNAIFVSMENLFLFTLKELEKYIGYLMTHKFGSHTLRVLMLVLAGEPIARSERRTPLQSKKKERVHVNGAEGSQELSLDKRTVPKAFTETLVKFIADCIEGLDTPFLQSLALHPTGNPTLQLLLQLELTHFGKERAKDENSVIRKLLPDDPITEGTDSAKFLNGLVYDSIGSRLFETIIEYGPAKTFKAIYREFFKDRLATLAKNDVASYVVIKLLTRLGKDDLEEAVETLVPQIGVLVERNRTALIKTIIERCDSRGVETGKVAKALDSAYGGHYGFDIARLLKLADPAVEKLKPNGAKPSGANAEHGSSIHSEKLHGSLLAQAMIASPGPLSDLIFESLARLGTPLSLSAARAPSASYTISAALTSPNASIIFRRKMVQQFYGHVGEMALDPSASHVIDAVWAGTHGLAFIRERIAEELAENEASLRESHAGRKVWRNWRMDLYKKRRREWIVTSRESAGREGFVGFPDERDEEKENGGDTTPSSQGSSKHKHKRKHSKEKEREKEKSKHVPNQQVERHLTALERARQKHAQEKQRKEREAAKAAKRENKQRKEERADEVAVA